MKHWTLRAAGALVMLSVGCEHPAAPERLDGRTSADATIIPDTTPDSVNPTEMRGSEPSCEDPSCAPEPHVDATTVSVWFEGPYLKGKATLRYFGNYGYAGITVTATKDGKSQSSPHLFTELKTLTLGDFEFIESPVAQLLTDGCGSVGMGLGSFKAEIRGLRGGSTLRGYSTQAYSAPAYQRGCGCDGRPREEGKDGAMLSLPVPGVEALSCDGGSGGGGSEGYFRHICITTIWGYYDPATGTYEIHGIDTYCYAVRVNAALTAALSAVERLDWTTSPAALAGQRSIAIVATGRDERAPARAVWLARPGAQPVVLVDTTRATVEDLGKAIAAAEVMLETRRQPPTHDVEVSAGSIEWSENWSSARGGLQQVLSSLRDAPQRMVPGMGSRRAVTIPLPRSGEIVRQ
jgi:hypothetical protein